MIDLHSHILYDLDDGAKTLRETADMLRIAKEDGIDTMVATPHYIYGSNRYDLKKLMDMYIKVQSLIKEEGLDFNLFMGNELYLDTELVNNLEEGLCLTLADTDYVLVEFPMHSIPSFAENIIYALFERGYKVILAHPERYQPIHKEPEILYSFMEMGCLIQVNILSIAGQTGSKTQEIAKRFFEKNWVQLVATDCHSPRIRSPVLSSAYNIVKGWTDDVRAGEIFLSNPKKVLENKYIDPLHTAQPIIHTKATFFSYISGKKTVNF